MTEPTWTADNGNGTYTNAGLFYEEFSDPDIIRVGRVSHDWNTTMAITMPGLPVFGIAPIW